MCLNSKISNICNDLMGSFHIVLVDSASSNGYAPKYEPSVREAFEVCVGGLVGFGWQFSQVQTLPSIRPWVTPPSIAVVEVVVVAVCNYATKLWNYATRLCNYATMQPGKTTELRSARGNALQCFATAPHD